MRLPLLLVLTACTGGPAVTPPQPDPPPEAAPADADAFGSYTLRFPDPGSQYLEVELVLPDPPDTLSLRMASWTPGSYKIRDYARNIDRVEVTTASGAPVDAPKTAKDTWEVAVPAGDEALVVRYRLYAAEMSVRENWVEPAFASLNGAPTYLVPDGHRARTYDVRILAPDTWPRISTALPPHPSGEPNRFRVDHYDVLVDSPVVLGDSHVTTWSIQDPADSSRTIRHRLVHEGLTETWDTARAARDTERISREIIAFWGGIPYRDYVFLNLITGGRGGLEHKASTLMIASPFNTRNDVDHKAWLGLVSHEFFHTWNVKRLRPAGLGPFDLSTETYTPSLWVAEGLTSYYDDLLLRRAGLLTDEEYLGRMSRNIERLQAKPGRFNRSLHDASHDAWIKYYQRDANHDNVSVSYYTKGSVVGFLLDAEIRDRSGGWKSLDDALRVAYTRHSGEQGFTAEQFQAVCEEVAGQPLDDFFDKYVRGTEELDYSTALRVWGLRFAGTDEAEDADSDADSDADTTDPEGGWLGVGIQGNRITRKRRDGPAWTADLIVGDELIAVDDYRVPSNGLPDLLRAFAPQQEVTLTVSRHGRLHETRVTLGEKPDDARWKLEIDPQASIEARDTRKQWWTSALDGEPEPTGTTEGEGVDVDGAGGQPPGPGPR